MAGLILGQQAAGAFLADGAAAIGLGCGRVDYWRWPWVAFLPESLGNLQCIDVEILPPGDFIAGLM
jgi:hypothetical protein